MKKTLMAFVCICTVSLQAPAQEATTNTFKSSLNAGVSLADGNSETMQANGALVTEGSKDGLGSVRAGIEINYGESTVASNKQTTVGNIKVFAGVKRTLCPRSFLSVDGSVLYDDIAQIDYRATLGPGLGVYAVRNDRTSLSVEAGCVYLWEKVAGADDSYLALRFVERLDRAIGKTAKVWQSLEYIPKADDFADYLLNAELGAEAAMSAGMNLRLVIQNKYDSVPGAGLEKNDLAVIGGISVSL